MDNTGLNFTQFGAAATCLIMLVIAVITLWKDNKELRAQMREDAQSAQKTLLKVGEAMTSTADIVGKLAERERDRERREYDERRH